MIKSGYSQEETFDLGHRVPNSGLLLYILISVRPFIRFAEMQMRLLVAITELVSIAFTKARMAGVKRVNSPVTFSRSHCRRSVRVRKGLGVLAVLVALSSINYANDAKAAGGELTGGARPDHPYVSQLAYLYAERFLMLDRIGETVGVPVNTTLPPEMGGDRLSLGGSPEAVRNRGLARIEDEKSKAMATLSSEGSRTLPGEVTIARSGTCPKGAPSKGAAELTQDTYRFQLKQGRSTIQGAIAGNRIAMIVDADTGGSSMALEPLVGTLEHGTVTLHDNSRNCRVILTPAKEDMAVLLNCTIYTLSPERDRVVMPGVTFMIKNTGKKPVVIETSDDKSFHITIDAGTDSGTVNIFAGDYREVYYVRLAAPDEKTTIEVCESHGD